MDKPTPADSDSDVFKVCELFPDEVFDVVQTDSPCFIDFSGRARAARVQMFKNLDAVRALLKSAPPAEHHKLFVYQICHINENNDNFYLVLYRWGYVGSDAIFSSVHVDEEPCFARDFDVERRVTIQYEPNLLRKLASDFPTETALVIGKALIDAVKAAVITDGERRVKLG